MYIQCRIPNAGLKKLPLLTVHYELWLAVQWANPGICGIQALDNIYVRCRIPNVAHGVTSRLSEAKGVSENETDSAA